MHLRPYQEDLRSRLYNSINPLCVLPTGGGKSLIIRELAQAERGRVVVLAHRQEIIRQLSETLTEPHDLIAPGEPTQGHRLVIASVDSYIRRPHSCDLMLIDEGHHALPENKWGTAAKHASRIIGFTATPERADGRALSLYSALIQGPDTLDLIHDGYLQKPVVYAPTCRHPTAIVGDVVEHYLKLTPAALGMTFATDRQHGLALLKQFRSVGIPAELVTAATLNRSDIMQRFRAREILQLINVDIYGEGTDVPDLEVVSLARPTASLAVHRQQCGRVMRAGGRCCVIIDHAGNTLDLGLPWACVDWTLEGRTGRRLPQSGLRACSGCTAVYERSCNACPYCGYTEPVSSLAGFCSVAGELQQVGTLSEIARIDGVGYFGHLTGATAIAARRRHKERQQAQFVLRSTINKWLAGNDADKFEERFGIAPLTAMTLGRGKALKLSCRVMNHISSS